MKYGFLKDNNGNKIYINDNSVYHEGKNLRDVINEIDAKVDSLNTSKQDKLTPGNNITIKNNIISAKDPYSTEEQLIGTWVDGKPLYRKVIETTMSETSKNGTYVNKQLDTNIPKISFGYISKVYLMVTNQYIQNIQIYTLPYINNAGNATKFFLQQSNPSSWEIILVNGNITFNNAKTFIVLEYTI